MASYPGFLNSDYKPQPSELPYINDPAGMLGPWLLAAIFCLMMQGVLMCQALNYIHTFKNDRPAIRALVVFSVALCTLKAAHMIYIAWELFITCFGNYLKVSTPGASIKLTGLESSLIGTAFFIHRTFALSRNWIFLVATIPALLLGLAGALITTVIEFSGLGTSQSREKFLVKAATNMTVAGVVVCNVLIMGFTCWYLFRAKTGFATTNSLISRLIITAIQSGAPPTLCAVLNLYFNSQPSTSWVSFFNSLIPFLYVFSMIFTLNARSTMFTSGGNAYEMSSGPKQTTLHVGKDRVITRPEVYISRQTHVEATPYSARTFDSKDPVFSAKAVAFADDESDDRESSNRASAV